METFIGMLVEQPASSIKIHLDHYVEGVVAEYAEYIKKAIRPKNVLITPNVDLRPGDTLSFLILASRSSIVPSL